eukprot:3933105-Rhodomonas_salina.2
MVTHLPLCCTSYPDTPPIPLAQCPPIPRITLAQYPALRVAKYPTDTRRTVPSESPPIRAAQYLALNPKPWTLDPGP